MATHWICPALLVVIDGTQHIIETNLWDQVAYKREHGRPIGAGDVDDPEVVAWLAWHATTRLGLFTGGYEDFLRAAGNLGIDTDAQAPLAPASNGRLSSGSLPASTPPPLPPGRPAGSTTPSAISGR
jgi:hypothetical protein